MPPDKNKTKKIRHQKCPPEICPTGKCPRNTDWNVHTQKCRIKPYTDWLQKNGVRRIPADLKNMVGDEIYKKEYEDKAVERNETISLISAPKIQIAPKPEQKPEQKPESQPDIVVLRKPKKISISSKPPIVEKLAIEPSEEKKGESKIPDIEPENPDEAPDGEADEEVFVDDNRHDFLYPRLEDPDFSLKIAKRKEFNDTQYDGSIKDIREQAEKLCSADFELMPHQSFVKNFMSFQTPYNSLLLYHGLGTGKTCSAIGIAEEMRNYMKQIGLKKSIMIVASPNVQDNFRLQLFDERKLELVDGIWNINSCVGNSLLKEINPTDARGVESDRVSIISQIKALIKQYYIFMGYTLFANYISESIDIKGHDDDISEKQRIEKQRIKNIFDNRLIIIDEVHNIKTIKTRDTKDPKPADLLAKVARNTDNMRLLLLSATPMYNSHEEIIWITNLMNLNDNRPTVSITDVFDKKDKSTVLSDIIHFITSSSVACKSRIEFVYPIRNY